MSKQIRTSSEFFEGKIHITAQRTRQEFDEK